MAPELAKKDVSCESEVDDILVTQLLTSIVISLGISASIVKGLNP